MSDTPKSLAYTATVVSATPTVTLRIVHSEESSHGVYVSLRNLGAGDVYVDSDVAVDTTTGFKLGAGTKQRFHVGPHERLYVFGTPPLDVRSAVTR
jgi:hypothetical protein